MAALGKMIYSQITENASKYRNLKMEFAFRFDVLESKKNSKCSTSKL